MAFERFPNDLYKYLAKYIYSVNDFISYSSLNRRIYTLFKDERKKFMPIENLICLDRSSFLLREDGWYAMGENRYGQLRVGGIRKTEKNGLN